MHTFSVGYTAIAINTVVEEDTLAPAKKLKGKQKANQTSTEQKKDIPLPPKLGFTEEELSVLKVICGVPIERFHFINYG